LSLYFVKPGHFRGGGKLPLRRFASLITHSIGRECYSLGHILFR
jgi:hypothetical protein